MDLKDILLNEVSQRKTNTMKCHLYVESKIKQHKNKNRAHKFNSVQFLSSVWLFATTWSAAPQASLFITNSWSVQPSHPLLSHSPPSSIRVFSNEYWSFSFSISPSNEYSGLISFRIDWFDLLAVQGTLKSLLQHIESNNLKASVLRCSVFFMVQLLHPYMTTGKTIAFGVGCQWFWRKKGLYSLIFLQYSPS